MANTPASSNSESNTILKRVFSLKQISIKLGLFLFLLLSILTLKAQTTILDDSNNHGFVANAKVGTVTIPADGYYHITLKGARGGNRYVTTNEGVLTITRTIEGGKGGVFTSQFYLTQGTVLEYCLGAMGQDNGDQAIGGGGVGGGGGGGGGTGVRFQSSGVIMAIAGGGGGANHSVFNSITNARTFTGNGSGGGTFEPQNSSYGSGGGGENGRGQHARWIGAVSSPLSPLVGVQGIQALGGGAGFSASGGNYYIGPNGVPTGVRGGGGYGGGGAGTLISFLINDTNLGGGAGGGGGYNGGRPGNNISSSYGGTSYKTGPIASSFTANNNGPGAINIQQILNPFLTITNASCIGINDGTVTLNLGGFIGGVDNRFSSRLTTVNGIFQQLSPVFNNVPAGLVTYELINFSTGISAITLTGTVGTAPPPNAPTLPVTLNGTINPTICNNTNATLTATCTGSTVKWYDSAGTALQGSGSPFTTPNLTTNTTYKVRCESNTCVSPFVEVIVSPIKLPTAVATNSSIVCSGSSFALNGSCSSGTVTWYNQQTGGTALGTGNEFYYEPTATSIYYASCESPTCVSIRVATSQVRVIPRALSESTDISFGISTISATETINATSNIVAPAKVTYQAGKNISLSPDFEVQTGSIFEAKIEGCGYIGSRGLIAYYPFNGNANDETSNGNHGVPDGPTLTTDRFGKADKAYAFDGIDDMIQVSASENLNAITKTTISFWAYHNQVTRTTDGFDWQAYFSKDTFGKWFTSMLCTDPDGCSGQQPIILYHPGLNIPDSRYNWSTVSPNVWYHITVSNDGAMSKFYVNGELKQTVNVNGSVTSNTRDLILGRCLSGSLYPLDGKLDDLRIYNRALGDAEVQALYNAEKL